MNRFVIVHREIGEPYGYRGIFFCDAENREDAKEIFEASHEDLPYFIESIFRLNSDGILYWIRFKDKFSPSSFEETIGLRVKENEAVHSVFTKYFLDFDGLEIIYYEIAPEWLQ